LGRVSGRECIDPCAVLGDTGEGRKWREIDFEEIGACRLAGYANIGHRDLLAVAISSGFLRARQVLLQRRQSELMPVLRPFDDACFIDLEFVGEIFAHPRHDQRVGIACDNLRKAASARARASRGSSGGLGCVSSRYSMIARDSKRTGPSPSTSAGIAIIGLTARNFASRCSPFIRLMSMISSGLMPLRLSAMRTR